MSTGPNKVIHDATKVIKAILTETAWDDPKDLSLDAIATAINVPKRSLQRYFSVAGTSFFEIKDKQRKAISDELLKDGFTINAVTKHLGFTDRTSYTHAHKRWHVTSPTSRKRLLQQEIKDAAVKVQ